MIKVGETYWTIVPIDTEDCGYDPLEPYQVEVDCNQQWCDDMWQCHVAGEVAYPPSVGCRTSDLFDTYAAAAAEYRKEIGALSANLKARAEYLAELAATFPDDLATWQERVRKETAEAEARYLEIERGE